MTPDDLKTIYLGLGGNVGDVLNNLGVAIRSLNALSQSEVTVVSNVYKTPPWGIEDQDWFLNTCVEMETQLSPKELLDNCLQIEKSLKRTRDIRWGPRTLDIDILLYGDEIINSPELTVPHPRMHERAFVLRPLHDIAPELQFNGKSCAEWVSLNEDAEISEIELPTEWWHEGTQ